MLICITAKCQLDCSYCSLDREVQDITESMLYDALDLLFTAKKDILEIQFFGGEPLLRFDLMEKAVNYATEKNQKIGKNIRYVLTTNGLILNDENCQFLKQHDFTLLLSIDGMPETQIKNRPLSFSGKTNYFESISKALAFLKVFKIDYFVNMVFMPDDVKKMTENVEYLIDLGVKDIQLAYAVGQYFSDNNIFRSVDEFTKIAQLAKERKVRFRNLDNDNEPILFSPQVVVSPLGKVYVGCALVLEKKFKEFNDIFYYDQLNNGLTFEDVCRTNSEQFALLEKNRDKIDKALFSNLSLGVALDIFAKHYRISKDKGLNMYEAQSNYLYHDKLMLMLTHKCQMCCRYCYLDFTHPDIKEEVIYKAIDVLFFSQKKDSVEIQFFGGEPLLRFDLMKKTINYAEKKCVEAGKKVKYLLATNGIGLGAKELEYLSNYQVGFILSIDGKSRTQRYNRPLLNKKKNYPFIRFTRVINNLVGQKRDFFINLVVGPKNVNALVDNALFFLKLGVKNIRLSYELGVFWEKKYIIRYCIASFKIMWEWIKHGDNNLINLHVDDEPSLISPVLTVDYEGSVYSGCTITLEKLFPAFRKINYIDNICNVKRMEDMSRTRKEVVSKMWSLSEKRELVFNNLMVGKLAEQHFHKFNVEEKKDVDSDLPKYKVSGLMLMCTYQCQLKCGYCEIEQCDKSMKQKVVEDAIDLLLTTKGKECLLRFWGGEPLLEWELIKKGIKAGIKKAKIKNKKLKFSITTNGLLLDEEKLDFLKKNSVEIMFSMDGDELANKTFRLKGVNEKLYTELENNLKLLANSGIAHFVNLVVFPDNVEHLAKNISFIKRLGVQRIQIGYQNAVFWGADKVKAMQDQIRKFFEANGGEELLMNFVNDCEPTMLSNEILVDVDGKLYLDGAVFMEKDFPALRKQYFLGDLKAIKRVDDLYLTKKDVFNKFKKACNARQRKLLDNNIDLGLEMEYFYNDFSSRSFQSNEHPVLIPVLKSDVEAQQKTLKKIGINSSFLYLNGPCRNNCIFCLNKEEERYSDPFKSERLIEKNKDLKNNKLCIVGNDPLLHPDIITIVELARGFNFKEIEIMTSGEVLANEGFTKKLINSGVSSFSLPLYSDIAQIHDFIVGVKGSYPKVLKGVENVLSNRGRVFVHSNLLKQNIDGLKKLEGFVKNILGLPFVILPVRPKSSNLLYKDLVPSYRDIVMKLKGVNSLMAFPLCVVKQVQKNIFKDESEIADSMKLYVLDQKFVKPQKCRRCADRLKCVGIFKEHGQMYGVGALKPFIRNGKKIS